MNAGHTPGYLLKKINEALCSAFPDQTELEMMVLFELNINLNEVASGGNLKAIVYKLIMYCQAYNQLEELIDRALKQNQNNAKLKAIEENFKITTSLINILITLEKKMLRQMQKSYRKCCPDCQNQIPKTFYEILEKLDDIHIHKINNDEKFIVKFVDHLLVNGNIPNSEAEQLKQWLEKNANDISNLLVYKQTTEPKGLKQFSFKVVTVNRRGAIINRESQQARYFTQNLGNGVDLKMVYIPKGNLLMGSPESEKGSDGSERPQHRVRIQPFFLGKYQVTQAQWRAVAKLPKVKRDLDPDPSEFKGE
ncbi:MAG: SUMF1/EgtB/PvdO family nonheme iron enzyme, partial [Moorea sp. SIO3C2]|nr:SUMF1/EgtB/PvdO family nonheme iron enzyme [Moorena sp. SIO3C2]